MEPEILYEWIGYAASFFVLVSLIMRSIKKLRLINLLGATLFVAYGYLIGAYPVLVMNLGIVAVNIYYLKQIFTKKDYFKTLPVAKDDHYTKAFMNFYKDNMAHFMSIKEDVLEDSEFRFLILRNMDPAGIFIAKGYDDDTMEITLDYAAPRFQDFKTGEFIYAKEAERFKEAGYKKMIAFAQNVKHKNYLKRMGFKYTDFNGKQAYMKSL